MPARLGPRAVRLVATAVLLGVACLVGSAPASGADALRFAQTKPVVLEPSVPVEVQVVVQRGIEARIAVEQATADAVEVMCGTEPPAAPSCTLPASDAVVIRTIKVAWSGKTPGKGTLVASATGVPAASLEFTAVSGPAAAKAAAPTEVTERTDDRGLYVQLDDSVVVPKTALTITGTGPQGVATAELTTQRGKPALSVKDLDAVGAYAWTIDKDGDGKADLTVKVMRREPFALGALCLVAGALVVGLVIWLRDRRLAALVQQVDVDGLREVAERAEERLADAMATVPVPRTNQLWAPATTEREPLHDELGSLDASDRTADRSDGAAFAKAATAVDALARVAARAERIAESLQYLRAGPGSGLLVSSTIAALEGVDFRAAALDDYAVKATAIKTIADNAAVAERIAREIGTRPQSEQDALYPKLYALAITDAAGLDSLRNEVGIKKAQPQARRGFGATVGSILVQGVSLPGVDAAGAEARTARRATMQSVRGWVVALSAGLAILSGLATTYFGSDTWGSRADMLKAFTWAAGATFTVDAVMKVALSRLAGGPAPKA